MFQADTRHKGPREPRPHPKLSAAEWRALHQRVELARLAYRKVREEAEAAPMGLVGLEEAERIIDKQRQVASQRSRVPGGSGRFISKSPFAG